MDDTAQDHSVVDGRDTEGVNEGSDPAHPIQDDADQSGLRQENAELKEKLMRALADGENLRRRTEKEIQDASSYAITKFAKDLLAIADNFERARTVLGTVSGDVDDKLQAYITGIDLVEKELHAVFARFGVEKIDALEQKFDPNLHQAMFEGPHDRLPRGTVFEVMQNGYVMKSRVLRPALVGVVK